VLLLFIKTSLSLSFSSITIETLRESTPRLTNVLALVEGFRDLPCEDGVDGAHDDEYRRIGEDDRVAGVNIVVADEQVVLHRQVVVHCAGGIDNHPDRVDQDLDEYQAAADDELRPWRYEGRPLCAAGVEDPRDTVGLGQQGGVNHGEAQAGSKSAETN